MKDLIIIGASGFGREVAWLVERINAHSLEWNILGFIDDNKSILGTSINGYKILGNSDKINNYPDVYFVCAIGSPKVRQRIVNRIKTINSRARFATLIDPSAEVSNFLEVGEGTIICAHTIITVNVCLGNHVIINLNCTIGHDAVFSNFVTLCPSVSVSGDTRIGQAVEVGTGARIIQGLEISDDTTIGAGAVVTKNITEPATYVGVPAVKK